MQESVFRRLVTSMKFWTMLLGGAATAGATLLARYGLELSDAAVQQIAGSIVVLFSILLHAQGQTDQGKNAKAVTQQNAEVINNPPATPIPNPAVTTLPFIALLVLSLAIVPSPGCGPSARQVQLKTAYVGLSTAADGLVAYSSAKQDDIVAKATSLEDGLKQLTAFKATRDKVADGISAAFHALAAASILDAGLANALSATAQALAAWEDLKGLK